MAYYLVNEKRITDSNSQESYSESILFQYNGVSIMMKGKEALKLIRKCIKEGYSNPEIIRLLRSESKTMKRNRKTPKSRLCSL